MEQTRTINLPIAGKLQHGEKLEGKGPKELGYFIARTQNSEMNFLINRFKEKYPKETKVNIRFFDENPLTIRNVRYNQSGAICYCLENSKEGKEKTKNGWKPIECKEDCSYRFTDGPGKPMCNREATLKFIVPAVTTDRIFLMKITGQTSIDRIKDYIKLQKMQSKSIVGDYTLSLHQEEQINREGKKFNNYILDIYKSDEFDSNNISQESEKIKVEPKKETIKKKEQKPKQTSSTKQVKKVQENAKTEPKKVEKISDEDMKNYYALISTKHESINDKDYLIGNFANMEDEIMDIIISPEYAEELENCDLGTTVKLDVQKTKTNKLFTKTIEYIEKHKKNVAA